MMTAEEFYLTCYPMLLKYRPIAMAIQVWGNLALYHERLKEKR